MCSAKRSGYSRWHGEDLPECRYFLTVLDAVSKHPKREGFDAGYRLGLGWSVGHDAGKFRYFCNPAPVGFSFDLNLHPCSSLL